MNDESFVVYKTVCKLLQCNALLDKAQSSRRKGKGRKEAIVNYIQKNTFGLLNNIH